ncbi:hypothetical protein [Runella sp. SP2]|uniref:hypothetical protein n=1 Tax=Runella sp. SP2 TaxID=2268026 RepID=UPI000F08FF29|nr:hypothetical protein [Runella sp. SP2]AYQ34885.1 hypothetical protein DTQ70_23140 [Runella sp. SP2]
MKTLSIVGLLFVSSMVVAQHRSISSSIDDNGQTMSIRVKGTIDGRAIQYDRTFDVAHLSKTERKELRDHVLDSLGIQSPTPPVPPTPPTPATPPTPPVPPTPPTPFSGATYSDGYHRSGHSTSKPLKDGFEKEVKYNSETGELFMRYRFNKDGEEVIYERTINAADKSEKERNNIIEKIEQELGLKK